MKRSRGRLPIIYHGFVEGDDIGKGTVDVWLGRVQRQYRAEGGGGTAKQIAAYLRVGDEPFARGQDRAFFAQGAFRALGDKMDPRPCHAASFWGFRVLSLKAMAELTQ